MADQNPQEELQQRPGERIWPRLLLYALLSYFAVFEKLKFPLINPRFGNWESWHQEILSQKVGAPYCYRLLTIWVAEVIRRMGISAFASYMSIRYLCTLGTLALSDRIWRDWLRPEYRVLGATLYALILTMSTLPLQHPWEPLNIMMFALCYVALQQRQELALYLFILVGALNKLTIVFIAPLAAVYFYLKPSAEQGRSPAKKVLISLAHGAGLALAAIFTRMTAASVLGWKEYRIEFWQIQGNLKWMGDSVAAWNWILIGALPMVATWLTWRRQPALVRAHSLMMPLFLVGHFMITIVAEFRTFIPTLLLGIPAVLILLQGMLDREAGAPGR